MYLYPNIQKYFHNFIFKGDTIQGFTKRYDKDDFILNHLCFTPPQNHPNVEPILLSNKLSCFQCQAYLQFQKFRHLMPPK